MGGRGTWGTVGPRGAAVSKPLVGQDPQTSDLHIGGSVLPRERREFESADLASAEEEEALDT